jgi:Glycoside Hydrolase Family 113/Carboxypeptidase regulatory-like domain
MKYQYQKITHHSFTYIVYFILIVALMVSCVIPPLPIQTTTSPTITPTTPPQETLVTFRVIIPQPLSPGDSLYITIMDEVTGLAFNSQNFIMQAEDALHYIAILPFSLSSVIKYRYTRQGAIIVDEHLSDDRPVRYRLYHVEGPGVVQDVVSGWTDTQFTGAKGRISGQITDATNGLPIPNLLITAGGAQALTMSDGSFLLEGLPPGTHNLVIYSLDGAYHIFQQGAIVAADSTTPVSLQLNPAKLVTVIITVQVPEDTPPDAPIRLAGNLYQLGNTFADLSGGVSTIASRMPVLGELPDGRYMITMNLPAGTDVEYKFTLGDGLWGAEHSASGTFRLRQLIVPETNMEIDDIVDTWQTGGIAPILFDVTVPANTPPNETISIQFNPGFGWLEPIPMWRVQNAPVSNVWRYVLTGPFTSLETLQYRYCRQDQCGSADDVRTMGANPTGRTVNTGLLPQTIVDNVDGWAWLSNPNEAANVPDVLIPARAPGFTVGIAFQARYHPSWGSLLPTAISEVRSLGVNSLIFSPTWTFTRNSPPVLEPLASQDMLWPELISSINATRNQGMSVSLFPVPHFPGYVSQWWQTAPRDFPWWVVFFDRYSNFIVHHADIASQFGVGSLIMGGDWIKPALPGGTLYDGTPSNVPQDAETRWRNLIQQVRAHYSGIISWALAYPEGVQNPPPFLDAVDQIYIIWSTPLANQPNTSVTDMQSQAATVLDQEILPIQERFGKPIIVAIAYTSTDGGAVGCIHTSAGGCLVYNLLTRPALDSPEVGLNMQEQTNAYNAVLLALNDRNWISGFVSMGYYPPAVLQDKSISIHGKPASGVVWYWSQKFLGR